ncbi:hypothetical protein MNBD_UNCLBAC01-527 [hydrothermal vent metagenome]|uniref:peptidylprolyl isomerase n=1 Tax=hydrothermal vent metagenome TaxID=652676 RepID=A0A3B1DL03_9ZZZZ
MKNRKKISFFVLSISLLVFTVGCDQISSITEYFNKPEEKKQVQNTPDIKVKKQGNKDQLSSNIVARVGSWTISKEEFKERLEALKQVMPDYDVSDPEARALVLEELVRQQLLVEEAEKSGLAKQKDIKAAVEEFRRTLIVREVAKKLTEGIAVTDEEAKSFYEEKKDVLVEPMQWHVREIVMKTQGAANTLLIDILKGVDFSGIAKKHSSSETAQSGGDLGFINDVPFAQMANPLLSLEVGDVSGVFKGPKGFYIIKLEEKKGGDQIAFEDIKEEIVNNQMLMKQQKVILDYIEELKQKFSVEINEELLK